MTLAARIALVLRLAVRELRGGLRGQGVFLACLVLGVGAVAAVGSLAASVEGALRDDARGLLGGDLEIRTSNVPAPEAAVERLRGLGRVSRSARLRTMARPGGPAAGGRPTLVELKAVDAAYPLVGKVELAGGMPLAEALAGSGGLPGMVAQRALMVRLGARVGEAVSLGGADFRLMAELVSEPDRATRFFGLGPRVIAPLDAVRRAGLLGPGSVVRFSVRLALPATVAGGRAAAVQRIQAGLERDFPDAGWRIRTFANASDRLKRFLDEFARYLTLVGLSSLLVGGIGVAGAVRSSLEARIGAIAAMKCLGATRATVVAVYLARTMGLALAGSLAGAALGAAVSAASASLMSGLFGVQVHPGLHPLPLALALGFGLLIALAFSLPHLSAAASVSPSRLFRGYVDPGPRRPSRRAVLGTAATALGLCGLTLAVARDARTAAGFAGAALAAVALFHAYARLLSRVAAWISVRLGVAGPRLRQALANIHRPGASTASVVFSLGLGLTVLCAVTLVDRHMQDLVSNRMAGMAPDYFFLDIPKGSMAEFRRASLAVPGVGRVDDMPVLRARITAIGGRPARLADVAENARWALRGDRALSFAAEPPKGADITAGQWWPADYHGPPLICLDAELGQGFGVGVGDSLTFNILGREVTARIACLRRIDYTTLALNAAVIFAPGALDAAPYTWLATAYARDEAAADALFNMVNRRFPEVASVYVKDVLREVEGVLTAIGLAVGAIAAVTLAAGLLVLAEALRANIAARHYDAVVFKVLGATRGDILGTLGLEFLLLGGATAVLAAVLGAAASWLFVVHALHGEWTLQPLPLAAIAAGGVLVTVVLGLLGVRRALGRPAWPVLRNE